MLQRNIVGEHEMMLFLRNLVSHQGTKFIWRLFFASWLWSTFALAASEAQAQAPIRPVVVIPGILGSILTTKNGDEIIWGDRLSLTRLSKLEIKDGPRDPTSFEQLRPVGLITSVQIFGPWKIKQYDGLRSKFEQMRYVPGVTYFEFPYDWRRSNLVTARLFKDWIQANERLREKEFDIVAHSMGGLIAEIYTKTLDDKRQVRRLVTLGTPYLGSVNSVATPFVGWGSVANTLAGGVSEIRRIVLSFPAFFELFPTYSNCCILGLPSDKDRKPFNLLSPEAWSAINWEVSQPGDQVAWKQRIKQALADAEKVSEIISLPTPDHLSTTTFRFAGDLIETRGQFYVDRKTGSIAQWNMFAGDGTVLVRSASKDNLSAAFVSFAEHQTIFDDNTVNVQLKRIFDPTSAGPREYNTSIYVARTAEGDLVRLRSVGLAVDPPVVEEGQEFTVTASVTTELGQPLEKIQMSARVEDAFRGRPLELTLMRVDEGFDGRKGVWKAVGTLSGNPGPSRVSVNIPGTGDMEDYVVLLGRPK